MNDDDFIKQTNQKLERRQKLKEKEKRPDAVKRPDRQRITQVKRLLKSRQKELESQEAKLFMKFAESYPPADLTLPVVGAIWSFLKFLKKNGYRIIDGKIVFCFPLSKMVRLKNLK